MPTQVRTFTAPKSLAETLSESLPEALLPGSLPPPAGSTRISETTTPNALNGHRKENGLNGQLTAMSLYSDRIPEGGITFAHQDDLPKLPIPELEETCQKYLTVLKPLQTPREHAETQDAVREFLKHEGPELQEQLKKYAEGRSSYIEQFWYESYLNYDNPVVLNLNPFFLLEDDPTPARKNQVTRAASLVVSALEFVRAVRKEELPPDKVKNKPLCMYQYSRLFGTARVPTENGCRFELDPDSKHIIVMCHGQFYWFDVLDDNSDLIMTEKDISINLQTITDDATLTPIQEAAKGALGVLSTENRKVWSGLRDVLTREEGSNNAECLGIVDSALFVLCLDYSEPATVAALCQNMLCGTNEIEKGVQIGTCTNRWYDKLQIIVCKNGSAGINFEHTGVDGHTVLRFASDVYTDTILRFARTINGRSPTLWASTSPDPAKRDPESFGDVNTTPHKLEWDLIPEVSIAVRFAETRLADLIGQNEFECLDFGAYGKSFITSMGFSPDAFVQMAFQAAYYGLYGRAECTYEPAMTKTFHHGRTEAIRTVTEESVNFMQTFWADHPAEGKIDALRKACKRHGETTQECLKAKGCDRHLYALLTVWQRQQFLDEEAALSTSSRSSSPADKGGLATETSPARSVEDGTSELPLSDEATRTTQSPSRKPAAAAAVRDRGDSITSNAASATSRSAKYGRASPPVLFADSGWEKLNNTILSTSNCGNPSLRQFGFGPVSGDGFGIGYIIKDESISICASSKHRQTKRFVESLESYLLEIRRVLRLTTKRSSAAGMGVKPGATRAREIDHRRPKHAHAHTASNEEGGVDSGSSNTNGRLPRPLNRLKSRGRMIHGPETIRAQRSATGTTSPTTESVGMSEDDELGGYGFFDAGMLKQALKARHDQLDANETRASERAAAQARRSNVGKKLRLSEY